MDHLYAILIGAGIIVALNLVFFGIAWWNNRDRNVDWREDE